MVRAVGIEPTLLAERDFESRASTNSTTPALREAYSARIKMRNVKSELLSLFRWFRGFLPSGDWRRPDFSNIDSIRINIVLKMISIVFIDDFNTCSAFLRDLINLDAFEQMEADIRYPQAVAGRMCPSRSNFRFSSSRTIFINARGDFPYTRSVGLGGCFARARVASKSILYSSDKNLARCSSLPDVMQDLCKSFSESRP